MSDITVGDYWGLSNQMKEYNKNGVSLIIVNTEHGNNLIDNVNSDEFKIGETDVEFALKRNSNYYLDKKPDSRCNQFKSVLNTEGLHTASRVTKTFGDRFRPVMRLAKNIIKKILHMQ